MGYIKKFNFASAGKPLMQTMLPNGKSLELYAPTKGEMERFIDANSDIQARLDAAKTEGDFEKVIDDLYAEAARLMNFNTEGIRFTGVALRETYRIEEEALLEFYKAYADFIWSITISKN